MSNSISFNYVANNPVTFKDNRGSLNIIYESDTLVLKRSNSKKGVFRGLHYQSKDTPQNKIIRVIEGKILDFITDPKDRNEVVWYTEVGPEDNWIHINSGLAHGFYALNDVVFEYICDGGYSERNETTLSIQSLLNSTIGIKDLIMSPKDTAGKEFGKELRPYSSQ